MGISDLVPRTPEALNACLRVAKLVFGRLPPIVSEASVQAETSGSIMLTADDSRVMLQDWTRYFGQEVGLASFDRFKAIACLIMSINGQAQYRQNLG